MRPDLTKNKYKDKYKYKYKDNDKENTHLEITLKKQSQRLVTFETFDNS